MKLEVHPGTRLCKALGRSDLTFKYEGKPLQGVRDTQNHLVNGWGQSVVGSDSSWALLSVGKWSRAHRRGTQYSRVQGAWAGRCDGSH